MNSAMLRLAANHPLHLIGADRSWSVESGIVEIFAVGEADEPTARIHLGTARAGGRIYGVDEGDGGDVRLLAVGDGAAFVRALASADVDAEDRAAWIGGLEPVLGAGLDDAGGSDTQTSHADDRLKELIRAFRAQSERDDRSRVRAHRGARTQAMGDALDDLRSLVHRVEPIPRRIDGDELLDAVFTVVARAVGADGVALAADAAGAGSDRLAALAAAARVRTRRLRLTAGWESQGTGAFVGRLVEDGRPVALVPRGPDRYAMVDPVARTRVRVDARLARTVAPEAVVVYRPLPDGPLTVGGLVRAALVQSGSDIGRLALYTTASAILALAVPVVTGRLVGEVIPAANLTDLVQLSIALLVATVAGALVRLSVGIAALRVEGRMNAFLVPAIWGRLLSLPTGFFRAYTPGDLATRAGATETLVRLVGSTSVVAVLSAVTAIASLALIWFYSVTFGILTTLLVGMVVGVTVLSARTQLRKARIAERAAGELSGMVLEFVSAISKLRVTGAQEKAFGRWSAAYADRRSSQNDARSAQNMTSVVLAVLPAVSSILLFSTMAFGAASSVSAGTFLAISAAFGQVVVGVTSVAVAMTVVVQALPGLERVRPILAAPTEDDVARADPGTLRGAVDFNGVSFRYAPDGPLVLDDVSISIPAGSSVALVGPSGSGKSTLGRLLLGFEAPEEGGVYLDDQDLAGLDVRAVRRQLGVVLQSVDPLPGSVLSNILGDSVELTIDDAWRAAEQAGLAADLRAMPMGMHTPIGEGGSTLSGGQRQRLLIARALANDPRILLFDEATSALDNLTQSIVADSLAALSTTRIIIAHRLSTVRDADRIYYLEHGRVVESGNYDELMAQDGLFAAQARRQLA